MQRIGTELCHTVERLHLLMPNTSSREYLTVSIGGAIGVLNGEESWQAVLEQADQALYKAKILIKINVYVQSSNIFYSWVIDLFIKNSFMIG